MAHVGDNGETFSGFYAGFACLDEFGNNISESPGTHRYFTVAGNDILDSAPYTWNEYSGSISKETEDVSTGSLGSSYDYTQIGQYIGNNFTQNSTTPNGHNVFKTGTKFVRPVMIFNYPYKDTAMQVDGFTIEDVTPSIQSSASLSVTATSITSTVSTLQGDVTSIDQTTSSIALNTASGSNAAGLMINPQGVQISGSNLEFSGSSFYFGIGSAHSGSGAFISGSNGNIEISSSNFHIQASGSAIFSGSISASDGDIGGWSLQPGKFRSNNITLSSSNEEIVIGPNKEIILSGSGAGRLAGGAIEFDKFGNIQINNAELKVTGGSGLQQDAYNSANSKWVVMDTMDSTNRIFYATYEPDTMITIVSATGEIISSSIQPEQYFMGEWGYADLQGGYIIDADKPIQIVTDDTGNAIMPFTMLSKEFYVQSRRDDSATSAKINIFSPYASASVTMSHSDGNDGTFTDDFNFFGAAPGVTSSLENTQNFGKYAKIQSDQPILAFHRYGVSSTTDLIGVFPPSKQLIAGVGERVLLPVDGFSLGDEYEKIEPTAQAGSSYGDYYLSKTPFQVFEDGDGAGSAGRYAIPVEMLGDRYIIPHDVNGFQIVTIEPNTIKAFKLQGNGQTELFAAYDCTAASKTSPRSINVGSSTAGGSGTHNSGMLFEGTAPFALMTNTEDGDEYMVVGYRTSQQSTYRGSTTISGDKVRTGKIQSNNWNDNNAGSLIDLSVGTAHLGGSGSNAKFYFNEAGDLSITGSITAESSTITGNIYADNIVTNSGSIGGWTISADSIESGSSIAAGGDSIRLWGSPTVVGSNAYQSTQTKLQGLSLQWHESNNAGHIVFGDVLTDSNGNPGDPQSSPAYNGWKGIQAQKWNSADPYFQLSFNSEGSTFATKNIIAGWEFTEQKIITYNGNEPLLELKSTTTAGDYIISASDFQVNTAGAFTASAGIIDGDVVISGSVTIGAGDAAGNVLFFDDFSTYNAGSGTTGVMLTTQNNAPDHTGGGYGYHMPELDEQNPSTRGEVNIENATTHGGLFGPNVLEIGRASGEAEVWMTSNRLIPFNENSLYEIEMRVKVTGTAGSNNEYAGITGFRTPTGSMAVTGSGVTYVNASGTTGNTSGYSGQHYFVLSGTNTISEAGDNVWKTYKGYFKGQAASGNGARHQDIYDPGTVHQDVEFFAPMFLLGHNNQNNKLAYIDYIKVTEFGAQGGSRISGDSIRTGQIKSNNWTGESGVKGTLIDLTEGRMIMRSGSNDYFHIDTAGNKAEIAGWTFNQEKFYSNPSNEVRGININKDLGIRGRNASQPFALSASQAGGGGASTTGNYNFNTAIQAEAETTADAK